MRIVIGARTIPGFLKPQGRLSRTRCPQWDQEILKRKRPWNCGSYYWMRTPEMLRAITSRWISEVPSKIV